MSELQFTGQTGTAGLGRIGMHRRGESVANLDPRVYSVAVLLAPASGKNAIFQPRAR